SQVEKELTFYDRVRLDPATLKVDIGDSKFARSTTTNVYPYAVSYGCDEGTADGNAGNVDLRGTPFTVALTEFGLGQSGSVGAAYSAADGQVVQLLGSGIPCGWIRPAPFDENPENPLTSTFQLQLTYRRPPMSCAEVKEANPSAADGESTLYVDHDPTRPWG